MLLPFNTVSHAIVTPKHKIILLVLHSFAIVMNHNVKICGVWRFLVIPVKGSFDRKGVVTRLRTTGLEVHTRHILLSIAHCLWLITAQYKPSAKLPVPRPILQNRALKEPGHQELSSTESSGPKIRRKQRDLKPILLGKSSGLPSAFIPGASVLPVKEVCWSSDRREKNSSWLL